MGVIDFHTHYFSRAFFDTLAGQAGLPSEIPSRLAKVVETTGLELPNGDEEGHRKRWLAHHRAHDLEHAVAFASVPEETPIVLRAAAAAPDHLTAVAIANPAAEGAPSKVRALLEAGARGILTFPAMHHYDLGDEVVRPTLDVLADAAGICYVHCGLLIVKLRDLLGLPRPQDLRYANPLSIIPAANAHPRVTFVIPHFGAGFFRETLMVGAMCPNVVVDTSSSNGWIATNPDVRDLTQVFDQALEVYGPDRILFGTDSGTFPAGWRADRLTQQRDILDALGTPAEDQERIFGANARRILRR